jgi:predicted enzyme related to lactoylglutathione lyase
MLWLHVADLDQTLHQVTTHGGQILAPPSPDGPSRTWPPLVTPKATPSA